jgi:ABC-2 type transport system ATP-binding protein
VTILNKGRVVASGRPEEVKATLVDEHLEVDAADRAALAAELVALGLLPPERGPADGPIRLAVPAAEVYGLVRRIETPLTLVRTHAPRLEDAYLELVAGDEE